MLKVDEVLKSMSNGGNPLAALGGGGMPGMMPPGGGGNPALQSSANSSARALPDGRKALPNNTLVTVQRLKSRPGENGKTGKIIGYDDAKQRYTVSGIEGVEGNLALKSANLVQKMDIKLAAIDENGTTEGSESGGNGSNNKWEIMDCDLKESDDGKSSASFTVWDPVKKAKKENVEGSKIRFPVDSCVRAHGLQSETGKTINGNYGVILSYDEAADRYMIDFGIKQLKIKPANIAV